MSKQVTFNGSFMVVDTRAIRVSEIVGITYNGGSWCKVYTKEAETPYSVNASMDRVLDAIAAYERPIYPEDE